MRASVGGGARRGAPPEACSPGWTAAAGRCNPTRCTRTPTGSGRLCSPSATDRSGVAPVAYARRSRCVNPDVAGTPAAARIVGRVYSYLFNVVSAVALSFDTSGARRHGRRVTQPLRAVFDVALATSAGRIEGVDVPSRRGGAFPPSVDVAAAWRAPEWPTLAVAGVVKKLADSRSTPRPRRARSSSRPRSAFATRTRSIRWPSPRSRTATPAGSSGGTASAGRWCLGCPASGR